MTESERTATTTLERVRTRGEGVVTVDDGAGEATVTGLGDGAGGERDEGEEGGGEHVCRRRGRGVERVTGVRTEREGERS